TSFRCRVPWASSVVGRPMIDRRDLSGPYAAAWVLPLAEGASPLAEGVLGADHEGVDILPASFELDAVAVEVGADRPVRREPDLQAEAVARAPAVLLAAAGAVDVGARVDAPEL